MQIRFYEKPANTNSLCYVGSAQHRDGMPMAHTLTPLARALDCLPGECMAVVDGVECIPFVLEAETV
jgi:hypothetical protein